LKHIEVFDELKVGLWTFEKSSNRIRKHYTPTRVRALSKDARQKAIAKISTQANLSRFSE